MERLGRRAHGDAARGACSEPTTSVRRFPVLDDLGSSDWASVSVGGDHTCALKTDGSAYCWGSNQYGQLGLSHTDTTCGSLNARYSCATIPQLVQAGLQFASISAGQRHTCAITRTREAYCWGSNETGQVSDFGNGGPSLTKVQSTLPWTQITAGFSHTCAVRSDGLLVCWGSNDRGQLGNGSLLPGTTRTLITAPVAAASAGQSRTCARTTVGVTYCWGAVWTERSAGLELSRTQLTPQLVPGAPALAWLSVGSFTTCGADVSGFAYCWEANPRGEMGTGTQDGSIVPVRVASDLAFVQLSAGIVQTCGIDISGRRLLLGRRLVRSAGRFAVASRRTVRGTGLALRDEAGRGHRATAVRRNQHGIRQPHMRCDDAWQPLLLGPGAIRAARRWYRGLRRGDSGSRRRAESAARVESVGARRHFCVAHHASSTLAHREPILRLNCRSRLWCPIGPPRSRSWFPPSLHASPSIR